MMGLRRTPLVLYILFVFHLHHDFTSVSSRSSSLDTNKESLHLNESKPVVHVFEGKARELAFVANEEAVEELVEAAVAARVEEMGAAVVAARVEEVVAAIAAWKEEV